MDSGKRSYGFLVTVVALAVAVSFSLRGDGRDGFWVNHPMLGALVSGLLLFATGALLIERFVERRNARRWAAAAIGANRDLGHALDETLATLWGVHSDPDPGHVVRDSTDWTPAWRARALPAPDRALQVYDHDDLPEPDYSGAALTPAARLELLLADEAFVDRARELVDRQRDRLRDEAKEWAGLMMWAQHSQEILNALGIYAEKHLSRLGYHLHCNPEASEHHRAQAVEHWILADVKGRVLLNTLWGTNTRYRFCLPEHATGVPVREAFATPDAVGRWRPPPHRHLTPAEDRRRRARRRWDDLLGR